MRRHKHRYAFFKVTTDIWGEKAYAFRCKRMFCKDREQIMPVSWFW